MEYVGEHLMPGKLGQFFVVLAFAASLVATLAYFKTANAKSIAESVSWRKMARVAFLLNIGICFYRILHDFLHYPPALF